MYRERWAGREDQATQRGKKTTKTKKALLVVGVNAGVKKSSSDLRLVF